ncbi:MAG: IS21 family transposase [Elusimicrobiota bacterium]
MNAETWAELRRLRLVEKLTVSEVARRMRMDRKTVRKALKSSGVPKRRVPKRASKLELYKGYIGNRLDEFPRITCVRLLRELHGLGFEGGISRLKEYVATIRVKAPEAFFRLETLPGEEAQVDWANCGMVRVGNATRALSAFVMVLSYSRMMYAEFTLSQSLEDFLAAHVRAFQFFGGITGKILYDNLKAVCLTRLGAQIKFNERFLEFSGHYLFAPALCQPGHGNEKGKVERGIQYLRSSFLDGRAITDWGKANEELRQWLAEVANVRAHSVTRRRPVDRFEEEKPKLRPVPELALDLSIIRAVKATSQALVHFDGNLYTVPFVFASKVLTLKAGTHEVAVFDKARPIAKHVRSYDRGRLVENPAHYAGLLDAKKAAGTAKLTDRFLALAAGSERDREALQALLKGLLEGEFNVYQHLGRIMKLAELYGRVEVLGAVHQALSQGLVGANYIQNIIMQSRASRGEADPAQLTIPARPEWEQISGTERDLAVYDDLFPEDPDAKKA